MKNLFDVSPKEYELEVKKLLNKLGKDLKEFVATHRETLPADDGEYEIDIVARFKALDVDFLVLIECKKHKNPVKRELVQALNAKRDSLNAQKAIMFSTSGFQSGAVKYAKKNGISLMLFADGNKAALIKNSLNEKILSFGKSFSFWEVGLLEDDDKIIESLVSSERYFNPRDVLGFE